MRVEHANETDIQSVVEMNNRFAPAGLTLARSEAFAYAHLADYRVIRSADGAVIGCVALDEYSPSVVELISLAVDPGVQGCGYGKKLIVEADGGQHVDSSYDADRDRWLAREGYVVVRYSNADILNNSEGVLADVNNRIEERREPN